jgi:hypothetical protein
MLQAEDGNERQVCECGQARVKGNSAALSVGSGQFTAQRGSARKMTNTGELNV